MPNRTPPRYVPTLTEVVKQHASQAAVQAMDQAAAISSAHAPQPIQTVDRRALAMQVIQQVRPHLEAELRSIAMELFEAQYSALLPSLHLQIEEAVREAIDQAFTARGLDQN